MIALIRADSRTLPPKPADPLRPAAVRTPRPIAPDACFHEAVSRLLIPEAAKEILVHNNLSQYSTLLLPWLGRCKPYASAQHLPSNLRRYSDTVRRASTFQSRTRLPGSITKC